MRCFEVWVNGQRLYTAGVAFPGRLHCHIVGRQAPPDAPTPAESVEDHITFGGTDAVGDSVFWPRQPLQVGDEIIVRVVEVDAPDEPSQRHPRDDAGFLRMERTMYEKMKQKFEPSGPTDVPPTASD